MNANYCLKPNPLFTCANSLQTKVDNTKQQTKIAVIKYCLVIFAAVALMAVVITVFDLGFNVTFVVGVALAGLAVNLLLKRPWRGNSEI